MHKIKVRLKASLFIFEMTPRLEWTLDKALSKMQMELNSHSDQLNHVKAEMETMKSANTSSDKRQDALENRLVQLERRQRDSNIIFKGFAAFENTSNASCIDAIDWLATTKLDIKAPYITFARVVHKSTDEVILFQRPFLISKNGN